MLRRTGLDELPEIFSIWKGEMSLVGPRALDLAEHDELQQAIPGFDDRLEVLPGLTGLSQIYNRADDSRAKVQYDLEYIDRMSPLLDLKILFLSVWCTVTARWDRRSGKPDTVVKRPSPIAEESQHGESPD